jgi:hypothetical protein
MAASTPPRIVYRVARRCEALAPDGALAVWSEERDATFEKVFADASS